MIDENAAVVAERSTFLETLKDLDAVDWDAPSLCEGWRVRDVASHVHLAVTLTVPTALLGLIKARGDINRFMADHVPEVGRRPIPQILAAVELCAGTSKIPPTTKRVEVAMDTFVHHHDIALPLGREVPSDPARLRWMADGMVGAGKPSLSGPRVAGLRLIATDIDWHYGTGPEVTGPVTALIMAGLGRRVLDDQLSGDGLAELQRRG